MAKIKVYELARELNMSNKALLDKIQKMIKNSRFQRIVTPKFKEDIIDVIIY